MSSPQLSPHHAAARAEAVGTFRDDQSVPAVSFGGSASRGQARPDSDIDLMVVVTEEEFARRAAEHDVEAVRGLDYLYAGGYFDAKVIDVAFLRDVDERGSEPARWAFSGVQQGHGGTPEIERLIAGIPVYPAKRDAPYLLSYATSRLGLYASRVFLASNRSLYQFHKWFLTEVERAPERPADLPDLIRAAVSRPGVDTAEAPAAAVLGYRDQGLDHQLAIARFVRNAEWPWRFGPSALEDR